MTNIFEEYVIQGLLYVRTHLILKDQSDIGIIITVP